MNDSLNSGNVPEGGYSEAIPSLSHLSPPSTGQTKGVAPSDAPSHPINHIPLEILTEIFLHLPRSLEATEAPLILTGVCRKWREAALACPELWDTIILPLPSKGMTTRENRLIKMFLQRSGARPLNVDLGLVVNVYLRGVPKSHYQLVDMVVNSLVPHAGRIKVLNRVMPSHFLHQFSLGNLRRLEKLLICKDQDPSHIDRPAGERLPDSLRSLNLYETSFNITQMFPLPPLSQLHLRRPRGNGKLSVPQILNVLSELPRLRSCTLEISRSSATHPEETLNCLTPIILTDLEELHITWSNGIDVGAFLNVLETPSLVSIVLHCYLPRSCPWTEIINFIKRCKPPLKIFSFKLGGHGTVPLSFLNCLKECGKLEDLSLIRFNIDSTFLSALTFEPGRERLVPVLKYLDLEWCRFPEFTSLLKMLKSRGCELLDRDGRLKYHFRTCPNTAAGSDSELLNHCRIENPKMRLY
ncbi:hypothetical protein DFH11DRAFT_1704482 [Phellopilus nigrolimitatus]|nr:hypothetical protein DFH11DRAFT_1704482 [Phellopilus nigrolimitatus]